MIKASHDNFPKGAGGFGRLGQGVDIDFVMIHGSRAQKRWAARQLKRMERNDAKANRQGA